MHILNQILNAIRFCHYAWDDSQHYKHRANKTEKTERIDIDNAVSTVCLLDTFRQIAFLKDVDREHNFAQLLIFLKTFFRD